MASLTDVVSGTVHTKEWWWEGKTGVGAHVAEGGPGLGGEAVYGPHVPSTWSASGGRSPPSMRGRHGSASFAIEKPHLLQCRWSPISSYIHALSSKLWGSHQIGAGIWWLLISLSECSSILIIFPCKSLTQSCNFKHEAILQLQLWRRPSCHTKGRIRDKSFLCRLKLICC